MLFLLGFLLAWSLVFITVEPFRLRMLWPVGLMGIMVTFAVDATGVSFNLYRFDNTIMEIAGVPLFYMLSNAAFGILIINFFPRKRNLNIPYLMAVTAVFEGLESIFEKFSYFTLLRMPYLLDWALDLVILTSFTYSAFHLFRHKFKVLA